MGCVMVRESVSLSARIGIFYWVVQGNPERDVIHVAGGLVNIRQAFYNARCGESFGKSSGNGIALLQQVIVDQNWWWDVDLFGACFAMEGCSSGRGKFTRRGKKRNVWWTDSSGIKHKSDYGSNSTDQCLSLLNDTRGLRIPNRKKAKSPKWLRKQESALVLGTPGLGKPDNFTLSGNY